MVTSGLYLLDVVLLPKQNQIAILVLGKRTYDAFATAETHARLTPCFPQALERLEVRVLGVPAEKSSAVCHVIPELIEDGWASGWNRILLCRPCALDLLREVRTSKLIEVQLGSSRVEVPTVGLSAGATPPFSITRPFLSGPSRHPYRISVAFIVNGAGSRYLNEILRYYATAGVEHIYIGVYMENDPGRTMRDCLDFMNAGFVSILDMSDLPGMNWSHPPNATRVGDSSCAIAGTECVPQSMKAIVYDWALFHAKSSDDLFVVHDPDEMMIPPTGKTIPGTIAETVAAEPGILPNLSNLCFFVACPVATYGPLSAEWSDRKFVSRAVDFNLSDGGKKGHVDDPCIRHDTCSSIRDYCRAGGYYAASVKSISVVRNVHQITVHLPGSCKIADNDYHVLTLAGKRFLPGEHKLFERGDLVVVHYVEEFALHRHVPRGHKNVPSVFGSVWAHRINMSVPPLLPLPVAQTEALAQTNAPDINLAGSARVAFLLLPLLLCSVCLSHRLSCRQNASVPSIVLHAVLGSIILATATLVSSLVDFDSSPQGEYRLMPTTHAV